MALPDTLLNALNLIDNPDTRELIAQEVHRATSTVGITFERLAPEQLLQDVELQITEVVTADPRPAAPTHRIINGENLSVLTKLSCSHTGKVDLIYIDPPYNTGFAYWKYNDKHSTRKDADTHSRWLSFMEHRLRAAKQLLAPTGVIFVAIGEDEQHRLRMLLDEIFGEENFLTNIVWQGETKGGGRFTGGGMEYMIAYANSRKTLIDTGVRWAEKKDGAAEAQTVVDKHFNAHPEKDATLLAQEATLMIRKWLKTNQNWVTDSLHSYNRVDSNGRLYRPGPLSAPDKPELRSFRPIPHPVTGKPCKTPANGWRAKDATMDQWIADGEVIFGPDETTTPSRKLLLDRLDTQAPLPSFFLRRRTGTQHLKNILGDNRFQYPKDHQALMRWIRMAAPKDAVILDFFGGSGTTAEAVIRLNIEDGGSRQCLLVTNNEVSKADDVRLRAQGFKPGNPEYEALGVFHHVTSPRLKTVVTGMREDGSKYAEPTPANLQFETINPDVVS